MVCCFAFSLLLLSDRHIAGGFHESHKRIAQLPSHFTRSPHLQSALQLVLLNHSSVIDGQSDFLFFIWVCFMLDFVHILSFLLPLLRFAFRFDWLSYWVWFVLGLLLSKGFHFLPLLWFSLLAEVVVCMLSYLYPCFMVRIRRKLTFQLFELVGNCFRLACCQLMLPSSHIS